MGIEAAIELGIKTACKTVTDVLDSPPVYRTFFLDDDTGEEYEEVIYPYVAIMAMPYTSTYKSHIRESAIYIRIATHIDHDKKRATLRAIYEAVRTVIESDEFTINGYTKKSFIVEDSDGGTEENENYLTLTGTVHLCAE
jgi:hypothetical protein